MRDKTGLYETDAHCLHVCERGFFEVRVSEGGVADVHVLQLGLSEKRAAEVHLAAVALLDDGVAQLRLLQP